MERLWIKSTFAFVVSIAISFIAIPLQQFHSSHRFPALLITFVTFELLLSASILSLLLLAAVQLFINNRDEDLTGLKFPLTCLLLSSFSYALPLKTIAFLLPAGQALARNVIFIIRDVVTATGAALLILYIWSYPSRWIRKGEDGKQVSSKRTMQYITASCFVYAKVIVVCVLLVHTHFEALPIQSIFTILGSFLQKQISVSQLQIIFLITVISIDTIIIAVIIWNYNLCWNTILNSDQFSLQQNVIPLRFYRRSVVTLTSNIALIGVASLLSAILRKVSERGDFLIITDMLGSSSISLAIFAYAIRELIVHTQFDQSVFPSWFASTFAYFFSTPEDNSVDPETDVAFVYRIADDREPENQGPIPKRDVFSFETAMLLFNMSWLATTYGRADTPPLTPEHFGRPMSTVRAHISNKDKTVHGILLEKTDRFIIAFTPVLPAIEKLAELRPLRQTNFSKIHCEVQALSPKELNPSEKRLLSWSRVHRGFSKAYCSVQESVHNKILELLGADGGNTKPIYVTGFGTGGSLATLCSLDLALRQIAEKNPVCVYSYGSPRVMNSSMAKLFEAVVPCRWRCVVAGDCTAILPKLPFYTHVSKVATFTRSGHLALERQRSYKWWQSIISSQPMHKKSSYFCAFRKWHNAYHVQGSIDLWNWPLEKHVVDLFQQDYSGSDFGSINQSIEHVLESPITDIEAKSLRRSTLESGQWSNSVVDDVIAFAR